MFACFYFCLFALEGAQINSVGPGSSMMQAMTQYPALGQVPVAHPYEPSQSGKELNKYASLKAVGKTAMLKYACMWILYIYMLIMLIIMKIIFETLQCDFC